MNCTFCDREFKDHDKDTKDLILSISEKIKEKKEVKNKMIMEIKENLKNDISIDGILNSIKNDSNKDPTFSVTINPFEKYVSINCVTYFLQNEDVNYKVYESRGKFIIVICV